MSGHDLCDHEDADGTSLHDASNGLPVWRCRRCDAEFTEEDLARENSMYAAKDAGELDEGWPRRYARCLSSLGYIVVPWPEHMAVPHAGWPADARVPRPPERDMIVIDGDVFRAMARALEGAL